ncbi:MAG TPA: hypothetical protein PLQ12_03190, partial [Candidatus Defluviicoccus seviourii]|nr:hypothetical protein [Candidatus Defluviicoccus seviourii]
MRRKVGRLRVPFEKISEIAAAAVADGEIVFDVSAMDLSRKSACYRRKNGSLTVCLIWVGKGSTRV